MRLVRLERQQSRVADDVRAALASLGRGSTVVGGIALIGVGTVTDRPVEAVVLLPHGVIIVIGVDLPDPALRLEAPLGAEWRADGWPLVADDEAVNPATEALDLSQACESRIVELVPGTAPVGTIVAVGPYVETVDQPASDLAGPVRVLHPTPTTMLAATVSLATAHRPRSVDQVRALIRGLAPDAPDFSDEVLLGEGFSRFSDDTPPESLWDTAPRVPSQVSGTPARGLADWRTETPSASGRTQIAPSAVGIPKLPDSAAPADSAPAETSATILDTAARSDAANSADSGDTVAAPSTATAPATSQLAGEPTAVAESNPTAALNTAATPGSTEPTESAPTRTPASPKTAVPLESTSAATQNTAAAPGSTNPTESAPARTPASPPETSLTLESTSATTPNTAAALGSTKTAEPAPPRTPAASPQTKEPTVPAEAGSVAALGGTKSAEPSAPGESAPAVPNTAAAHGTTKLAEPAPGRTTPQDTTATAEAAPDTAAVRSTKPTDSGSARTSVAEPAAAPADSAPAQAAGSAANAASSPGTTKSAEPGFADSERTEILREPDPERTRSLGKPDSERTETLRKPDPERTDPERTESLGKPAAVLPLFPGAEQIPPYRPAAHADTERTDSPEPAERTETLPHPGAAAAPWQDVPRPRPTAAPTSRTVRWLPLGAIGLLVALVVAAVVVATSGDDTTAAPASPSQAPAAPPPTKAAPAESLQFSLRAADGDQRCASHAFGDAQASLQQTSCSGVRRASYTATVDGRAGAVTIGIVAFPDAAQAAAFKAVTDTPGGGGILDLAAETGKWSGPAPKFENAAYTSKLEGTSVRVVQAVWVPGPSTPDDPGLARAAKAALDLPAQ
ncbi:hypothetical protein VA596_43315 [Amycolatopsis sp., V23-08]|uniref:Uncharacterized protein n=1 Tax=Amycolatopsis heterodermiae TaxID=3110235 RepID=A0ABU5RLE4_9PSEU|nr:hypothetical protein [Amycolatopsis sp., V23-08]MEA5366424.1 hypothetical protein [Amycolatopsis sp., V23-08]